MTSVLTIGIANGCVYALVAVGYSLIYRTTGIVNFAQGCFVMLGGIMTWWLLDQFSLYYPLAIAGGVIGAGIAGLVMYLLLVLPLWRRRAPPFIVILGTLAFSTLISNVTALGVTHEPQTLPTWFGVTRLRIGDSLVDGQYILLLAICVPLFAAMAAVLQWTGVGRAMRACAANRDVSELLGISPERVALVTLVATGALGGLGGALITPAQFTSATLAPLAYGTFGFIAAILGGLGTFHGAMAGGVLIGLIQAVISRYVGSIYDPAILYGILIALLMLLPKGLFGDPVESDVL